MNENEFISQSVKSGYATEKAAKKYVQKHKKDRYEEADFIELYRNYNWPPKHVTTSRSLGDGNSTSKSYRWAGSNVLSDH